jgi:endothelin-converting enzyme
MRTFLAITLMALLVFVSCTKREAGSGIDRSNFDESVRPRDDFYQYVNGAWLEKTEIPEDKSNYGAFIELIDESEENLRVIIEEAANAPDKKEGSEVQKVGDFYLSFMDTALIEEQGLFPIKEELARINNVNSRDDLIKLTAYYLKIEVSTPFVFWVNQDFKNTTEYTLYFHQSGLGLPDRDYYFKEDQKFKEIREKYLTYIEKILTLGEQENAPGKAKKIMEMETVLAKHHWTRVENRDRNKTYNKYEIAQLNDLTPDFDWNYFMQEAGISNTPGVIIRQPSFFEGFNEVFTQYSPEDWKTYFTWKLLNDAAPLLNKEFVATRFDFYGKTLRGIEKNRPRWKRGVAAVNDVLGEVVGKIYVEKHFKPEAKTRMVELVNNLVLAYEERIKQLDWMSEETKQEALEKLSKFIAKIGYPDEWKDYSKLAIKKDELLQNYIRSSLVKYEREINKLGMPIDRKEWFMNPQRVNAYYNPAMNEVVFPAAILQPPFFNMDADDAVNYGAIGAVIGHELTHGFDDQGRKSDGNGTLRDWWTEQDTEEFTERSRMMVEQYNEYTPVDTMRLNGNLTLGENIADLGGLTIAYNAYKMSLKGNEAPVIDGFTGEQRFFLGYGQVWRRKYRDEELRNRILTDPHSPSRYRVVGVLSNMPEFYAAFDVQEGDPMYRLEDVRVAIW